MARGRVGVWELRWYSCEGQKDETRKNRARWITIVISIQCCMAFLCVVTQRSTPALRDGDDTKNGCEADYFVNGSAHFHHGSS